MKMIKSIGVELAKRMILALAKAGILTSTATWRP